MLLRRALAFSVCVTVANWCAITVGVFVTTALQRGLTTHLVQQLFRVAGSMLSPGWLYATSVSAGLSLVGWLIARRACSASGSVRLLLPVLAMGFVGFVPACVAFAVFSPAFVGLAVVLLVSGGAAAFVARGAAASPVSQPESGAIGGVLTQRTVFGRRGL